MEPANRGVLVLNQDMQPLNICRFRRALGLLFAQKAEVMEYDSVKIRTVSRIYEAPSVIRLLYFVMRPRPHIQLSRKNIFARDSCVCQYCGKTSNELTVDHVIPKRLGGKSTWENLVAACKKCNNKKGDKTLEQAKMKLITLPKPVKHLPVMVFSKHLYRGDWKNWKKYLV